jgi:hypothetical protein
MIPQSEENLEMVAWHVLIQKMNVWSDVRMTHFVLHFPILHVPTEDVTASYSQVTASVISSKKPTQKATFYQTV